MKIFKNGGVTAPKGFCANGVAAGIKRSGKRDLTLVVSDCPAVSAAVYTKNSVKAAPLLVSQKHLRGHKAQAIIANSGNANCFTGKSGLACAQRTTEIIGKLLGIPKEKVVVASTGIIGRPLSFKKIQNAAKGLVRGLSVKGEKLAAEAILTTDLKEKTIAVQVNLSGKTVTIGACAKGSGMIAPDMATMLAYVATDAAIPPDVLHVLLRKAVNESFNMISVDSDTSTSDTVMLFATGKAAHGPLTRAGDPRLRDFRQKLDALMGDLARQVVRDGEGARKFIAIRVGGAASPRAAKRIAMSIANSPLVKTAIAGEDANWGRIVMAVGKAGEAANRDALVVRIGGLPVARNGMADPAYSESRVTAHMKGDEISIDVDVGVGKAAATVWTCDLTHGYIDINADYRS